ncbi:unnamed protein product [Heligmosomoides polygyrus]|uniref:Uncharacterized protein n=1 Tax=Heligmosomoides polygyrus TaxID=6339 RepID=A0A183FYB4_HELPZ|nr:unnamed protein product [Heligmosomoides polygyrus]
MRSLCFGVILLALGSRFVASFDLDGCLRGPLLIETAKSNMPLRERIREDLSFSGADGTVVGVLVINKHRNDSVYAGYAERRKGRYAVAFEFDPDHDPTGSLRSISFDKFFNYLTCKQF